VENPKDLNWWWHRKCGSKVLLFLLNMDFNDFNPKNICFLPLWFFKSRFADFFLKNVPHLSFKRNELTQCQNNTRWTFRSFGIFKCAISSSLPFHLFAYEFFVLPPPFSLSCVFLFMWCYSLLFFCFLWKLIFC